MGKAVKKIFIGPVCFEMGRGRPAPARAAPSQPQPVSPQPTAPAGTAYGCSYSPATGTLAFDAAAAAAPCYVDLGSRTFGGASACARARGRSTVG